LENSAIDLVAEDVACKQTILKVMCSYFKILQFTVLVQLRHEQVECMQRIAAEVYNLITCQKQYTIAQLQHQAVIIQKEQVQRCQVEVKHRLEEAEVLCNVQETIHCCVAVQGPIK